MRPEPGSSLGDDATFAGRARPQRSEVSLGEERTVGDGVSAQVTILDDIEIVDLEARYRIEGGLGQGGMGAVLLATDTRLGRKVAIKRILGEAAGNTKAVQRFINEAKAIAALNHPNVVHIYEYGRAKDGPFLIMEYVDGGSLLDRCRDGALPLENAVELACQICDGLAKAHDLGIIHRDIKPANVLLTKDGTPKLTDFGLAKAQAGDHGQTVTGAVLGTPDFMPPEQRRDASLVDHRSDLWSLAATVYQMVTGRSPKVIRLHELPLALQGVLAKALEDEKDARYQSARELRDALKASLRTAATPPAASVATEDGELQEGQCTACGTVNSDLGRKFCRKCGGAMRVACLKCDVQIPVWDSICGECGANQQATLMELQSSLQAERDAAEASARTHAYANAISAAERLAALTHPALAEFAEWGRSFVATATGERDRQLAAAAERLGEARSHRAAFDYAAAIHAIEAIPEPLRSAETEALLAESVASRDEAEYLLRSIKERYESRELEGLIPTVERAIVLRGDRAVLQRLRQQLVERRDSRLAQAKAAFDAGDSRAARAAVNGTVEDDLDEPSRAFVGRVRFAAELEDRVATVVKEAKAHAKAGPAQAQAILVVAQPCLEANPANSRVQALIAQCQTIVNPDALTNSIGIEMKLLPAGSFSMGDAGGNSDETPHPVTLTRSFYIGVYPVTTSQWKRVMGSVTADAGKVAMDLDDLSGEAFVLRYGSDAGLKLDRSGRDLKSIEDEKSAGRPVTQVSWGDAVEFCRKLSALPEERAAGRAYRLPTEAEWEYACRAGTWTRFSFGDHMSALTDFGWSLGNSGNKTHPVGKKKPNAWGLFDMHGNVCEWCSDWYGAYPNGEVKDPQGASEGASRVYRGGGWISTAKHCRSADRNGGDPTFRSDYLGFRLAMSLADSEPVDPLP